MREYSGIAGGIAGAIFFFFASLAFVLVVVLYTFFTIYAMVKWSDFDAAHANVTFLLTGVAVISATLVVVLVAAISLAGRAMGKANLRRGGEPSD